MNGNTVPPPAKKDLAKEHLAAAVESAIGVIQEHLTGLDADRDAKWSVSELVKLLQLREELQEQLPRTVYAGWVDGRQSGPSAGTSVDLARNSQN